MRYLKLTVAYDGTNYAGWQHQPARPTIQTALEATLQQVTGEAIKVVGSGRTDAGVHALGQVASIATSTRLTNAVLLRALNAELPRDILVTAVDDAPDGFHAIRHAVNKRYRYWIHDGRWRDLFRQQYAWHVPVSLDVEAMHTAAQALVGTHDFSSFESTGSERGDSVRTVTEISARRAAGEDRQRLAIEVAADGFLYNMVRAIVGTLVEVGRGSRTLDWPATVLARRDRSAAGATAPAHGLFLVEVDYEHETGQGGLWISDF